MLSRRCRRSFTSRNLSVRRSRVVHAVSWADGIGGEEFPIPACRVGVTGWSLDAFRPVSEGVNCERCLHNTQARAAAAEVPAPRQLALDLDGVTEIDAC